jgi:hypothetical protein
MRFSSATTLFSLASIAQAAPTLHQRESAPQYGTNYGAKYQAGIFYVNWVSNSKMRNTSKFRADNKRPFTVPSTSSPTCQLISSPKSTMLSPT